MKTVYRRGPVRLVELDAGETERCAWCKRDRSGLVFAHGARGVAPFFVCRTCVPKMKAAADRYARRSKHPELVVHRPPRERPDLRGSKGPHAKLTEADVEDIIKRLVRGHSLPTIAQHYHVHQSTIYWIQRGITWRHVRRPTPWPPLKKAKRRPKRRRS